ncbi:DUF6362 family protein [Granulicella paludicola]|uniref:DUF6362 family protein n=1 Tax=Granulicella paludicola TaxID=474951 RepID=UPI0037BF3D5F
MAHHLAPHPDYERKLVWLRANRVRWKRIEQRFGHSRTKLHNDYRNALMTIMTGLQNSRPLQKIELSRA